MNCLFLPPSFEFDRTPLNLIFPNLEILELQGTNYILPFLVNRGEFRPVHLDNGDGFPHLRVLKLNHSTVNRIPHAPKLEVIETEGTKIVKYIDYHPLDGLEEIFPDFDREAALNRLKPFPDNQ